MAYPLDDDPPPRILTVNAGSSSVKVALFDAGRDGDARRLLSGQVDRIDLPGAVLAVTFHDGRPAERVPLRAGDASVAGGEVIAWLRQHLGRHGFSAVGHRVVHGGTRLVDHQLVTDDLVAELRRCVPLDPAHLPREIALIEAFGAGFPGVPQVACFDSAFHRDLPDVAKMLPIPRRYADAGVRRLGFHGLSYAYLMDELRRVGGDAAVAGRVILAHLGSGASMAAVRGGRPVDTTMGFTPSGGLVMGTRPGDLDPGLLLYLMQAEGLTAQEMEAWVNGQCGLLGVSGTTSDMRELIAGRAQDARMDQAVRLFCYQARKFVGALAAAMGGLDTLVFSGGIGEHSPEVRSEICDGLAFLGVRLDPARNAAGAAVISDDGAATVRVIPTDEELMIAKEVLRLAPPNTDVTKDHL